MADSLPFGAEYAKTGRASCKGCKTSIGQGTLRMSMRKPSPFFDGLQDNWYHFDCFWQKLKSEINEASIKGLENLKWEDAERVKEGIAKYTANPLASAPKAEVKAEYAKTAAGKCASCKEKIPKGEVKLGVKTSWYHVGCFPKDSVNFQGTSKDIKGYDSLDDDEKKQLDTLFKKKKADRKETDGEPKAKKTKGDPEAGPSKEEDKNKAALKKQSEQMWKIRELLKGLSKSDLHDLLEANGYQAPSKGGEGACVDLLVDLAMFGVPKACPKCKHNGTVQYNTSEHSYRCTGNISEYTRCTYSTKQPDRKIFKVPSDISGLDELKKRKPSERVYSALLEKQSVVTVKTAPKKAKAEEKKEKTKVLTKNGYAVDPDCDDHESYHVFTEKWNGRTVAWQTTLGHADVERNKNSFYKLQLVKHDQMKSYALFRSWGRIGTSQGGCKTDNFGANLDRAKAEFENLFKDKSGNTWGLEFVKKAGFMDQLEMEVFDDEEHQDKKLNAKGSKSKLHKSIQELVSLIFDVEAMKATMIEMEIDMDKMPLGKLSRKHILNAYGVLTELQNMFKKGKRKLDEDKILDATNRFYTLIPHNTGREAVARLNNEEIIKQKTELLDNLLEIQLAYSIAKKHGEEDSAEAELDPIDESYRKLKTNMTVLDHDSEEFQRLLKYTKNTHAATHNSYSLDVIDIYTIDREGEQERFTKELHNRQLLWHGSRLTNYVGILSQGLRIAPPEAPVTGYMFGKGIYFADMVSKSANYCHANGGEGLLLLCDVALGEVQEETSAKMITKLDQGKHSCKGLGGTCPDPKEFYTTEEGVRIPYGKPSQMDTKKRVSLLYNEYIVYDVKQVNIKYMIRARFNSRY
uniref:Poly [ADP-ribose] polymerase n=1 Tax=Steinernema glaseri TaxID=37863 RepID=A0A1I8ABE0_9BILA